MPTSSIIRNALILCALSVSCFAGPIYLASSASETANNSGSATVNIPLHPAWAAAFVGSNWVSYTQSGDPNAAGFVQVLNGTSVVFSDTFTIADSPNNGTLYVMADDTTSVSLNGVLLADFAPVANNSYAACSDFPIGCTTSTAGVIDLSSALQSGTNTLSFTVQQLAGGSFGLDYSATINSPTPEPGTMVLFGLPLIALSLVRRKRSA